MRSKPARDQFALHAGKPFARIASLLHRYHTEWLNELGILTKQARIKSDVVDLIFQATVPVTRSASIEFRHQVSKLTYEPSGPSDWRLSPVSMLRVKVFLFPLDGMLVHRSVTTQHQIRWYPFIQIRRVERGAVRVKCLAQKRNTMYPVRARNRIPRSGRQAR